MVIEDAAQGLLADYRDRPLGGIGHMAALSFHETKNIISGEGGALLVNDPRFVERAEVVWEKGTNRSQFFRGQVDKYTWVDLGSSYLPGEIIAAFLWAQMEEVEQRSRPAAWRSGTRTTRRSRSWSERATCAGRSCRRIARTTPTCITCCCRTSRDGRAFIDRLKANEIQSVFHYIPLHSSPFGRSAGRSHGDMSGTDDASDRLVRLPLWLGLEDEQTRVIDQVIAAAQAG